MKPATELPWELSNKFARDKVYEGGLLVANCHVESDLRPKTACEQNAAYIVHACNLHGELVKALKLVCHALGAWRDGEGVNLEELKYMVVDRAIECAEPGFDGGETTLEELRDCIAAWQLTSAKP